MSTLQGHQESQQQGPHRHLRTPPHFQHRCTLLFLPPPSRKPVVPLLTQAAHAPAAPVQAVTAVTPAALKGALGQTSVHCPSDCPPLNRGLELPLFCPSPDPPLFPEPIAPFPPLSSPLPLHRTHVSQPTPPTIMPRPPGRHGLPGPVGPVALLAAVLLLAVGRGAAAHGAGRNVAVEVDRSAFPQGMRMRDIAAQASLMIVGHLGTLAGLL